MRQLLQRDDFTKSEAIVNTVKEFKLNSDSVNPFLEDGNYAPLPDKHTHLKALYGYYRNFRVTQPVP